MFVTIITRIHLTTMKTTC